MERGISNQFYVDIMITNDIYGYFSMHNNNKRACELQIAAVVFSFHSFRSVRQFFSELRSNFADFVYTVLPACLSSIL